MVMYCPVPDAMLEAHGIKLSIPLDKYQSLPVLPFLFLPLLLSHCLSINLFVTPVRSGSVC